MSQTTEIIPTRTVALIRVNMTNSLALPLARTDRQVRPVRISRNKRSRHGVTPEGAEPHRLTHQRAARQVRAALHLVIRLGAQLFFARSLYSDHIVTWLVMIPLRLEQTLRRLPANPVVFHSPLPGRMPKKRHCELGRFPFFSKAPCIRRLRTSAVTSDGTPLNLKLKVTILSLIWHLGKGLELCEPTFPDNPHDAGRRPNLAATRSQLRRLPNRRYAVSLRRIHRRHWFSRASAGSQGQAVGHDVDQGKDEHQYDHDPDSPVSMCVLPKVAARVRMIPWIGSLALHIVVVRAHCVPINMVQFCSLPPRSLC